MGDEIDTRAAFARFVEVERWGHDLVADGEDAEDAFHRARAAEKMADGRLGAAHRHGRDIVAEQALDRAQFQFVAEGGRCAVGVHIVDVSEAETRFLERHLHRTVAAATLWMRGGDMIGIAGQAIADDFGIDVSAALLGMLIFFEHDHARAFAHDETVAVDVIGTARLFGRVVEGGRQRARLGETCDADRADRAFGATRKHNVGVVHRDHARSVADRVRTGRAGGDHRMVGTHQTVLDRNLAGNQVDEAAMDEVRANAARPLVGQHQRFAFDARQATDPRTDGATGAQTLFLAHIVEARIAQRLAGGGNAIDDEGIDLTLDLVIHVQARIIAIFMVGGLHFAGDAALIFAGIKARDRRRAGL